MKNRIVYIMLIIIIVASQQLVPAEINYNKMMYKNSQGEYFYSLDKGQKWQKLRFTENPFTKVIFKNQSNESYQSNDKGVTWKKIPVVQDIKESSFLSLQISPNPTYNNKIIVKFDNKTPSFGDIKFFDINGVKVKSLSRIKINEGLNEIELETKDFNLGIYFVLLETDGKKYTGKFIISD